MHLQQHTAGHRTSFHRERPGPRFETFSTYLEGFPLRDSAFVGCASEGVLVFACFTEKDPAKSKIRSDADKIMASNPSNNLPVQCIRKGRNSCSWPSTNAKVVARGFPGCLSLVTLEMGTLQDKIYRGNSNCRQTVVRSVEGWVPTYSRLCVFSCKVTPFRSGRCWVRTSDLCRVKADP